MKCKKCGRVCKNKQGLSKHKNVCSPEFKTIVVDGMVYVSIEQVMDKLSKIKFN